MNEMNNMNKILVLIYLRSGLDIFGKLNWSASENYKRPGPGFKVVANASGDSWFPSYYNNYI